MRFSRERIFSLAGPLTTELLATEGVSVLKPAEEVRAEVIRALTDEAKVEDTIDQEVRRILQSYSRPAVPGSPEWEILYQKTREEVSRRRFRF